MFLVVWTVVQCHTAAFELHFTSSDLRLTCLRISPLSPREESELWSSCERAQCGGVWVSVRVFMSELTHQEACWMCQRLRYHDCISEERTESKSEFFSCVVYAWFFFASFTVLSADPIHSNHLLSWRSSQTSQNKRAHHYVSALPSRLLCGIH